MRAAMLALLAPLLLPGAALPAADETDPGAPRRGQLDLSGGRTYPGEWHPGGGEGEILWRPSFLAEPVPFPMSSAVSVTLEEPRGGFPAASATLRLADDLGSLPVDPVSLDGGFLVVESPLFSGRVAFPREIVRRIEWREAAPGYLGPGLPAEWQPGAHGRGPEEWRTGELGLSTDVPGTELWKDLGLDAPSRLELSLIATGTPAGFRLVLGAPGHGSLYSDGLFVETWGNRIVAYRELEETLEITEIGEWRARDDLIVDWDPERRIARIGLAAEPPIELRLGERTSTGLALRNIGAGLALRSLLVTRTNGLDGIPIGASGELDGEDVATFSDGVVRLATGAEVPLSEVAGITFPPRADPPAAAEEGGEVPVRLGFRDRSALLARYRGREGDELRVHIPALDTELRVPVGEIRFLEFLRAGPPRPLLAPHRLVAGSVTRVGTCSGWDPAGRGLLWQPDGSAGPAPLAEAFEGSVQLAQESEFFLGRHAAPHDLHLADGDRLAVRVIAVDETEIVVDSPFGGEHRIPAEELRAIELDSRGLERVLPAPSGDREGNRAMRRRQQVLGWHAGAGVPFRDPDVIDADRRRRALELPRRAAARPPTHLLVGRNGDILRGRLLAIDASEVVLDVHLEEVRAAIEDVVAIIRLDPPAGSAGQPSPGSAPSAVPEGDGAAVGSGRWVQLVLGERMRVNARLVSWDGSAIVADTRRLGRIEVPVADVERVVLGDELRARLDPRFAGWRLEVMPDPTPPPAPAEPEGG